MGRVLMLANSASFFLLFNRDNIRILQNMGEQVEIACNFKRGNTCDAAEIEMFCQWCDAHDVKRIDVPFAREIVRYLENVNAYRQLLRNVSATKYDFIHCHTPIGGVIGRMLAHKTKTPVIYTAHGFHFFRGAKLSNWLFYYPVERLLAGWTTRLITINREDYVMAKKFVGDRAIYVNGVGLDTQRFHPEPERRTERREALGLSQDEFMILMVGELIPRKNHALALRGFAGLRNKPYFERLRLMICGIGNEKENLQRLVKELGIADRVSFLGYRSDIERMYTAADLFLCTSRQEGLSVALMSAMGCGLPIICTEIRGNADLVQNEKSALFADTEKSIGTAMDRMITEPILRKELADAALKRSEEFSLSSVRVKMEEIYREMLTHEKLLEDLLDVEGTQTRAQRDAR